MGCSLHLLHQGAQRSLHHAERGQQQAGFVTLMPRNVMAQVKARHAVRRGAGQTDRLGDAAHQPPGQHRAQHQRGNAEHDQGNARHGAPPGNLAGGSVNGLALKFSQGRYGGQQRIRRRLEPRRIHLTDALGQPRVTRRHQFGLRFCKILAGRSDF